MFYVNEKEHEWIGEVNGMKAVIRNILIGAVCVLILLVIAYFVFTKDAEPTEGVLSVPDGVTSAEIVYDGQVYFLENEQLEEAAEYFRKLKAAEYDIDTGEEEQGIIIKFFVNGEECAKFGIVDSETIWSYAPGNDAMIWIYKTKEDVEGYFLEFIEKCKVNK